MISDNSDSQSSNSIVSSKNCDDIDTALKTPDHKMDEKQIKCIEYDSADDGEFNNIDNTVPLFTINEYCLRKMFEVIGLREKIRLTLTNAFLNSVLLNCTKGMDDPKMISELANFCVWEIIQFFKIYGRHIKNFIVPFGTWKSEWHDDKFDIYKLILTHSKIVQRLELISEIKYAPKILMALRYNNITEMELFRCNLKDNDLKLLKFFVNLTSLGIACNYRITGMHISKCVKLTQLGASACLSFTLESLLKICKSRKLTFLDIRHVYAINNITPITQHIQNIEILKISLSDRLSLNSVLRLRHLRVLQMDSSIVGVLPSFYQDLTDNCYSTLEELKLSGQSFIIHPSIANSIANCTNLRVLWLNESNISNSEQTLNILAQLTDLIELSFSSATGIRNEHMEVIILKCKKLRRLNLRFCRTINESFVFRTMQILSQRVPLPPEPLHILLGGSGVKSDILKNEVYQISQHIILISMNISHQYCGLINELTDYDITDDRCSTLWDRFEDLSNTDLNGSSSDDNSLSENFRQREVGFNDEMEGNAFFDIHNRWNFQ